MSGLYGLTFLRSLGQTLIFPFAALFMAELTGNTENAALTTGIMIGAASIAGAGSSVWLGQLGDRIGHGRIMTISALCAVIAYLPQPFVTSAWQLILLQALAGAAIGGLLPTVAALMNLWTPSGSQGATYGLENSVTAAARVFAPMIGAAIITWVGLRGLFGAGIFVYLITALLAMRVSRTNREPEKRVAATGCASS
jgi:DHA1 family multidrug resistance protein-like MFS transporter